MQAIPSVISGQTAPLIREPEESARTRAEHHWRRRAPVAADALDEVFGPFYEQGVPLRSAVSKERVMDLARQAAPWDIDRSLGGYIAQVRIFTPEHADLLLSDKTVWLEEHVRRSRGRMIEPVDPWECVRDDPRMASLPDFSMHAETVPASLRRRFWQSFQWAAGLACAHVVADHSTIHSIELSMLMKAWQCGNWPIGYVMEPELHIWVLGFFAS